MTNEWIQIIAVVAMFSGILGAMCISFKHPLVGSIIWAIGTPLWILWGCLMKEPAITLQFIVYEIIAIIGIYNWGKKR